MHQALLSLFGLMPSFAAEPLGSRSGSTPDMPGGLGL